MKIFIGPSLDSFIEQAVHRLCLKSLPWPFFRVSCKEDTSQHLPLKYFKTTSKPLDIFIASTLSLCSLASLLALLPSCESQSIFLSWFSPDAQGSPGYQSNPLWTGANKWLGKFKVSSCAKWHVPEPHFFDLLCVCISLLALICEKMVTIMLQKCPFQCCSRWSHPTISVKLSGLMFQVSLNVLA